MRKSCRAFAACLCLCLLASLFGCGTTYISKSYITTPQDSYIDFFVSSAGIEDRENVRVLEDCWIYETRYLLLSYTGERPELVLFEAVRPPGSDTDRLSRLCEGVPATGGGIVFNEIQIERDGEVSALYFGNIHDSFQDLDTDTTTPMAVHHIRLEANRTGVNASNDKAYRGYILSVQDRLTGFSLHSEDNDVLMTDAWLKQSGYAYIVKQEWDAAS